jgi:hypothetical protein
MAKKKKSNRRKKEEEIVERSTFWPLAGGIFLCIAALFLLFGGFGTGGPLPTGMFHGAYWAFGWAAYLIPFALMYYAVLKFTAEDHRIPFGKGLSMAGIIFFASSWLMTAHW